MGYTHSRGVAFLEGGCDERDAGKKKEGTDGRVEGSNFLGKALAKCRAHLSCNLHSHTHQRFLEGGSGEVFWVSVLVVLISGKGELEMGGYTKAYAIVLEMGEKGTRKMGGMNTYKLNLKSTS